MPEKLRKTYVRWIPSTSPDVVGYKIYYEKAPAAVGFTSPFVDAGMPAVNSSTGKMEYDLTSVPALTQGEEAVWNLGVAAVDDVGNEGIEFISNVPLDLVAPSAPSGLEITRI